MKIYTKTGDKGTTALYGGGRMPKNSLLFDVIGEFDELSSRIGILCSQIADSQLVVTPISTLRVIQSDLQDLNSIIAGLRSSKRKPSFGEDKVSFLEQLIDKWEKDNTPLTKFILPGVTSVDSAAHMCRTQSRKAERYIYRLHNSILPPKNSKSKEIIISIDPIILQYVNRLSDFFFVLARWLCKRLGKSDAYKV